MIAQSLRLANDHQEQLRADAAHRRVSRPRAAGRIVASVAAILRTAFAGPAIATGTILPATH